jgi:hypothetical protein
MARATDQDITKLTAALDRRDVDGALEAVGIRREPSDSKMTHESPNDEHRGRSTLSRRTAMTLFATAAAGASPVAALSSMPSAAAKAPDPIFALITAHKQAIKALDANCLQEGHLEETVPAERRKSNCWGWKLTIVETDDPRWIAAIRESNELSRRTDEIAAEMVSVDLSVAGAAALLQYAIEHTEAGYVWPDNLADEDAPADAKDSGWFYFLHRNLLSSLENLAAA